MPVSVKSNKVENYVRQQIVTGEWPAGAKVPSDNELCSELGVSYMTVKTVLSRLAGEGLLTRKRRLGTHVSEGVACGNIAIVVRADTLNSPVGYYYRALLRNFRSLIDSAGCRCILAAGHGEAEDEFVESIHLFDTPVIKQTIGLICFDSANILRSRNGREQAMPIVYMTSVSAVEGEHSVVLDYGKMLEQGVALLKKSGFSDHIVVHVGAPDNRSDSPLPGHDYGIYQLHTTFSKLVNRINQYYGIIYSDPHQHNDSNYCHDIQGLSLDIEYPNGANYRQGNSQ